LRHAVRAGDVDGAGGRIEVAEQVAVVVDRDVVFVAQPDVQRQAAGNLDEVRLNISAKSGAGCK
jgi:hypothetical protein